MGLCNEKMAIIKRGDYIVPDISSDIPQSREHKRSFSDHHSNNNNNKTKTKNHNTTTFKAMSGSSQKQSEIKHLDKSKRSSLFSRITEKQSLYQTRATSTKNYFSTERKKMKEIPDIYLTSFEQESLRKVLKEHFIFKMLSEKNLHVFLSKMKKYQIEEEDNIFLEGEEGSYMYLILSGEVELYKLSTTKNIIKSKGEFFGELGAIEEKSLRTYEAKALTKGFLYGISSSLFEEVESDFITHNHNELMKMIENVPLFSYLEVSEKENISKFAYVATYQKNDRMMLMEPFYIIKKGFVTCIINDKQVEMRENMYYGINNLLLEQPVSSQEIEAREDSEVYIIPLQAFIEILGLDYHYQLIYPYFISVMGKNKFFSSLFNELQLVAIYQLFKINQYKRDAIICKKGTSGKIVIILKGHLIYQSVSMHNDSSEMIFEMGVAYGDDLITSGSELEGDIIAKSNSIVLECNWEDMKSKVTSFNSAIIKKMRQLSYVTFLNKANESKLLEIASIVQKKKYLHGDIICKKDYFNTTFFLVIKGEAKLINNNKTIKRYSKGNCFGEMYILELEDYNTSIVASSKKLSLYAMPKQYFMSLINKNPYNDIIRSKMCNEDREITIDDLFIWKEVSKKSYFVHNGDQLYMTKTYNKTTKEFPLAFQAMRALHHLDHPFIAKFVKMVESKQQAFFLYEYIVDCISIEKIISSHQTILNKTSYIMFYCASFILLLDYINSKHFMHRNITPEDILIDSNGYIKLINFSLSKKPKNKLSTSSVIGVPCFTAPEVLKGDDYSYACDYWSVGVVLYYLINGSLPYGKLNDDPLAIYSRAIETKVDYSQCDTKSKELFEALIEIDPKKRCASLSSAKKLNCFKEYDFDYLLTYKPEPPFIPKKSKEKSEDIIHNQALSLQSKFANPKKNNMITTTTSTIIESWDNKF